MKVRLGFLSPLIISAMLSGSACAAGSVFGPDPPPPPWRPMVSAAPFCSPLPAPTIRVERIKSGDVDGLLWSASHSSSGTTLLLEDGVYQLAPNQAIEISTPNLTIRSRSGNRDAVIIQGGYNNVTVNESGATIADVTLRGPHFHNVQVRGENGVVRTQIYNVHGIDAGQQFIKVSTGDGRLGKFADDGLVACSLFEYVTFSKGTDASPPTYTDGVDILAGKGWVVRDNVFRRIRSEGGPAGPAILVWKNALNTVITRNLIVDCWRGITLGLNVPDAYSRDGPSAPYDHQNGLVENNVILALHEPADAAIENNFAKDSKIFHNTVYYREGLRHAVNWSIEYRFTQTTATIVNNLTNMQILKRQPMPTQDAVMQGNITNAEARWFVDVLAENAHLIKGAGAIDRGAKDVVSPADIDGTKRPVGQAPDAGADEFEG